MQVALLAKCMSSVFFYTNECLCGVSSFFCCGVFEFAQPEKQARLNAENVKIKAVKKIVNNFFINFLLFHHYNIVPLICQRFNAM